MSGTLTGHGYKETDLAVQRLLSEWNHFFPVRPRMKNTSLEDDHIMPAVEVVCGKMPKNIQYTAYLITEPTMLASLKSRFKYSVYSIVIFDLSDYFSNVRD